MKKVIVLLLTIFVVFGTIYSHNAQSTGAYTEVYVQDLKRQIAQLQAKVNNGTATAYDRQLLAQLRQRLAQLGR